MAKKLTDNLRRMYPGILHLTYPSLVETCRQIDDPRVAGFLTGLYFDVQRNKSRSGFEGWNYSYNPFLAMDLGLEMRAPNIPEDILEATHHMVTNAMGWLGIGAWSIAEEYFKAALSIDFVSNNVHSALICGANLGLCYLAGEDTDNAYCVVDQVLEATIETDNPYPGTRMGTIKRICLARWEKWPELQAETRRLESVHFSSLDHEVDAAITDIYEFLGYREKLVSWKKEWANFQRLVGVK